MRDSRVFYTRVRENHSAHIIATRRRIHTDTIYIGR